MILNRVLKLLLIIFLCCHSQTGLASGSIAGNPADDNAKSKPLVWFLGDKPIKWCVQLGRPGQLYTTPEKTVVLIQTALKFWQQYLVTKKLNEDWYTGVPEISFNQEYHQNCQGNEDLTFFIGAENDQVRELKKQYTNPSGFAELLSFDEEKGWGQGIIWIKAFSGESRTFTPEFELASLLLHELGHTLGCGHVEGTIMSADLVSTLNQIGRIKLPSGFHFVPNIDLQKEMYFAPTKGVYALSYIYIFPSDGQKLLVKELLGIDLVDPLHMGFIEGENENQGRAKLYIAYPGDKPLAKPTLLQGAYIKEGGTYTQKTKLEGKVFEVSLDVDTLVSFNTSDNPIFRVRYQGKEYSKKVPGYLMQGRIDAGLGKHIPIVLLRNKGDGEYVRISALINNKQVPFFDATLTIQPYW